MFNRLTWKTLNDMNKIDIIQRLLDEKHITAKEALVLMQTEKEYVYYPYYPSWYQPQPIPCSPWIYGTYSDTTNSLIVSTEN